MKKSISLTFVYFFMIVCGSIVFANSTSEPTKPKETVHDQEKLHVAVYYESLCPDSIRFIINQLAPTYSDFKDHIIVELIPFGKSESFEHENRTEFSCQHGPAECSGNKLQSCTLKELEDRRDDQIKYVACQMDLNGDVYEYTGKACADTVNVNWSNVDECVKGPIGIQLQLEAEQATHVIAKPYPAFIPTIVYNRVWNSIKQRRSLYDFQDVLCHELVPFANGEDLPSVCYSKNKQN